MAEVEIWEAFNEIRKDEVLVHAHLLQHASSARQRRVHPSPAAMPLGQEANATEKHLAVASWAEQGKSLTSGSLQCRNEQPHEFKIQKLWFEKARNLALCIKLHLSSKICMLHPH